MQGIIEIEPKDILEFKFEENEIAHASFVIKNLTKQEIAFWIKTTAPQWFQIKPGGIIQPKSKHTIEISASKPMGPDPKYEAKFQINACIKSKSLDEWDMKTIWKNIDQSLIQQLQIKSRINVQQQQKQAPLPQTVIIYSRLFESVIGNLNDSDSKMFKSIEEDPDQVKLAQYVLEVFLKVKKEVETSFTQQIKLAEDKLKENSYLQTNQLQTQQIKKNKYQNRIKILKEDLNDFYRFSQEINQIQLALQQSREEGEEQEIKNNEYDEKIKDSEISFESLNQNEQDSPKKISKLQQENTEIMAQYTQFQQTTQIEINQLKYEKEQYQNEITKLKQKMEYQIEKASQVQYEEQETQTEKTFEESEQRNQKIDNNPIDCSVIELLKKKVEDLDNLRKQQVKEINRQKDVNNKLEEKIQILQKHSIIRRQSDSKDEGKNLQVHESISRLHKQINQYQKELILCKSHNFYDQNELRSYELEALQLELGSCKDQLLKQEQKVVKYKEKLDFIYSLFPNVLTLLQNEPQDQSQQQQSQQLEKYQIQNFLYIKQQGAHQSQYFEVIGNELRIYKNQKNKLQKSLFDSYRFDEVFFDTQNILQYFGNQKQTITSNSSKVFLIMGESKTQKKLIMIILIELINNLILQQCLKQKVSICYQEKVNNQWVEIEYMNTQKASQQNLVCTIESIISHLQTKQSSTGEKIRKLSIVYQYSTENQISSTLQLTVATCSIYPPGDFKGIAEKILNLQIDQNMQFIIFLNITSLLQHQQKTTEILLISKLAQQVREQLQIPYSKSTLTEQNQIDDESQKQIRILQNKLILKKQELDLMKKLFDKQLKQIYDLQIKLDEQAALSNTILQIKQQINLEKQNKNPETIQFLEKLAIQLGQFDLASHSEKNEQPQESK